MSVEPQSGPLEPEPIPGTHVFWGYHDLILFGGALLPSIALGAAAAALASRGFGLERSTAGFVFQFMAYGGWFAGLYLIFRLRYGQPFWESLGWRPSASRVVEGFGSGLIVAVGLIFVSAFLEKPPVESPMQELLNNETTLILVGIFSTTLDRCVRNWPFAASSCLCWRRRSV